MKRAFFFIMIACAGLIQLTLLDSFKVFGVKPDLLLAAVLTASFMLRLRYALILGFICGVFKDSFLPPSAGLNTALFLLWSYLVNRLSTQISTEHILVRVLVVLALSILHNLICGLSGIYSGSIVPFGIFFKILLISPLYTVLAALLFLKAARISALED